MTTEKKSSKVLSTLHQSQRNIENQDPGSSGPVHVRQCVSRLPVLAKTLHLPTSTDFILSHCKWEEKPLAGKAKTKKPCTRPVPFNLTQPKSNKVSSENQQPPTVFQTRTTKWDKNVCSSQHKITNMNLKKSSTIKDTIKSQPLGQSRHLNPHKSSVSNPLSCVSNTVKTSAEVCSENMNQLTLKDASNTSKPSSDKVENFQHNHAALLSILRNEGVTPQSKQYNYLPQRVSVMKSHQKTEPNTGSVKSVFSPDATALKSILQNEGVKTAPSDRATSVYTPMRVPVKKNSADPGPFSSIKAVQFSPDVAALQSILQNEGVKAVGLGATPRTSVCPSGRGTSIYAAQRVPVRKNPIEAKRGTVASLKDTPGQNWSPQRVAARPQPMSAMKWHTSQQSPYAITPGLRGAKANVCPQQEEVVQRLFDDQDEQTTDQERETESPPEKDTWSAVQNEEEEGRNMEPFIQAPERQSVIFFSTGKKMFREPRFKEPESTKIKQQSPEETIPVLQSLQINTAAQTLPTDLLTQKTGLNPVVAMLRKRLPSLEEMRLDEEVATYTSVCVPTVSGFHPPRMRCGNSLATILHFEESTRFIPIGFDMSPDSSHKR